MIGNEAHLEFCARAHKLRDNGVDVGRMITFLGYLSGNKSNHFVLIPHTQKGIFSAESAALPTVRQTQRFNSNKLMYKSLIRGLISERTIEINLLDIISNTPRSMLHSPFAPSLNIDDRQEGIHFRQRFTILVCLFCHTQMYVFSTLTSLDNAFFE